MFRPILGGVLLLAAPCLLSQSALQITEILRFTLEETPEQILRGLGQPVQINDGDAAFRTWYFQTDVLDKHDHSHILLFRQSDKRLLSVTRNYHFPVNVAALFPAAKSTIHHWPDAQHPQLSVQVREYDGDRVLIAMGVAKPGQPTTQLIVMRRTALKIFFPWLSFTP
ncbi:MAG: hypothetical protein ACKV2U_14050 [Bryobacteraceae bacterium]